MSADQMTPAYLELDHVTKEFGDVKVVQDMHLSASAGEFVVLVGASGCGKSTTLRMIAGLEHPSSGTVKINGRDVTRLPPARRDIAMVFQNYALYPHMSVRENMSFALQLAGTPAATIASRVADASRILGIDHLLTRKPRDLSGGQRQRVAMGRAIVREPSVFLFDEPLSNLDAKLRANMRTEIALLHKRLRKTTVYVTHDQIEAMTLADRIVVMDKGRIQQMGSPEELFSRPVNQFVAGFIGSPLMNFLPVEVVRQGDVLCFTSPAFTVPVPASLHEKTSQLVKGEVVLGVRPHALAIVDDEPERAGSSRLRIRARVNVCEFLGNESQLICSLHGHPDVKLMAAVAGNQTARTGDDIVLVAEARHLHAFVPGSHGATLAS
jgi:ABC-type sugar transport system ATPase subunit